MMKKLTENYKITMSIDKQIDSMTKDLCHTETCEIKKIGIPCNHICKAHIYATRAIDKGYRKASEVAMEIFDEIESCKWSETQYGDQMLCFEINSEKYTELKKKYESEKDDG